MSEREIAEAKQEILAAVQRYQTLAAHEDGEPDRTVLDWIVVYHSRNFDEPHATGGQYSVAYAPSMQYHSMVGLLQMGVDAVDDSGPDDD